MQHQTQTDETLVMLTLAGEQSACEIMVIRYQKAVISAAAVTHSLFLSEDAAQDAFVTAWMKLNTLQEPQKFAAWVCRIARNCALNMVMRFRSFLPLETVENLNLADGRNHIFRNSSFCDGYFWKDDLALGETCIGSDGTTLAFVSDCKTVQTLCGNFEGCQLWVTKHFDDSGCSTYKSYYKDGVGIVKHEHKMDDLTEVRVLKSYHIAGGEGLLPMASGNTWEYSSEYSTDVIRGNHSMMAWNTVEEGKNIILQMALVSSALKTNIVAV